MAVDVPGALTLGSSQLMVEAAADGLGIAYVPEPYAQAYVLSSICYESSELKLRCRY